MNPGEVITKVTQIIQRDDGSEVRIICQASWGMNLELSEPHTEVYRRESPDDFWKSCSDRPHPDWLSMPIDQYLKEGRSEMLQAVSFAELFKVSCLIGKPMSCMA